MSKSLRNIILLSFLPLKNVKYILISSLLSLSRRNKETDSQKNRKNLHLVAA